MSLFYAPSNVRSATPQVMQNSHDITEYPHAGVQTSPKVDTSTRKPTPKAIRLDDVGRKQLRPVIDDMRTPAGCRSVPSSNGFSLPVPRSPLGIMNGRRDNDSTRMRTKRHQAPPNASQGTSTPAFRHMRTKPTKSLRGTSTPGSKRHQAQPSATKRNERASRGSNLYPGH